MRIPVIPGVNDSPEEIRSIAEFARLMSGVDTIHLLPYHTFGENKYTLLGRIYPMAMPVRTRRQNGQPEKIVESMGFHYRHIGG